MFQIDWALKEAWQAEVTPSSPVNSNLSRDAVRRTCLLHWEDHCLECSAPLCYSSCNLYVARPDKRCARFLYGIYPNPRFRGLFDFGADIRFRRWGKVEAIVYGKTATVRFQRAMDRLNRLATNLPGGNPASREPGAVEVAWKKFLAKVRNKCFSWFAPRHENAVYDEFVLECFSPDQIGRAHV